jgi:hypothetical protein
MQRHQRSVADANLARGRGINVSRKVGRVTCDFQNNNLAGDQEGFAKINIDTLRTIEEDLPVE